MPGKKLLVADDSLTIQKVIRLALSNEGYEIQTVSDGSDAVQQLSVFRPDVVLIDVSLPTKSAFEVKREVNEHDDLRDTRFVLMSSAFEKVDEVQAEEVVFHARLTKPFDPAHLRQVLSQVLAQVSQSSQLIEKHQDFGFSSHDLPPMPPPFEEMGPPPLNFSPDGNTHDSFPGQMPNELPNVDDNLIEPLDYPPLPPSDLPPLALPSDFPDLPNPPSFGTTPKMTPPPPPPPREAGPGTSDDSDIRTLMESTIRISGADEYDWSVNEPTPPKNLPDFSPQEGTAHFQNNAIEGMPSVPVDPPSPPSGHSPSFSSEELEAVVRSQVQILLEQTMKKMLPEIAEKVIKQEIHRLLSESP